MNGPRFGFWGPSITIDLTESSSSRSSSEEEENDKALCKNANVVDLVDSSIIDLTQSSSSRSSYVVDLLESHTIDLNQSSSSRSSYVVDLLESSIIDLTQSSEEEEDDDEPLQCSTSNDTFYSDLSGSGHELSFYASKSSGEQISTYVPQMGYKPVAVTHSAASAASEHQFAYEVDYNISSRLIQVGDNLYFREYEIGYIVRQIERIERWRSPTEHGSPFIFVYFLSDYGGRTLNTYTDSRYFHKTGTHNNIFLHEYKVVGNYYDVNQAFVPRSLD